MVMPKHQPADDAPALGLNKKRKTMSTQDDSATEESESGTGHFRFMDLPSEMRIMVYEEVLQDGPYVRLLRSTAFRNLATNSGLVAVCKQVREEFLSAIYLTASVIETTVINFNFSHLITFFNRLSDAELSAMSSKHATTPSERTIQVRFVKHTNNSDPEESVIGSRPHLRRWLNRIEHPTKKGTKINCQYSMARGYLHQYWSASLLLEDVLLTGEPGSRRRAEGTKILKAIDDRKSRP